MDRQAGRQAEGGKKERRGRRHYVHAIDQGVERLLVPRLQILFLLLLLLGLYGVLPHKRGRTGQGDSSVVLRRVEVVWGLARRWHNNSNYAAASAAASCLGCPCLVLIVRLVLLLAPEVPWLAQKCYRGCCMTRAAPACRFVWCACERVNVEWRQRSSKSKKSRQKRTKERRMKKHVFFGRFVLLSRHPHDTLIHTQDRERKAA